MTMEEMWNTRASSNKSSAQPGPSTPNQFNMDPGQLTQPYMAKEVCVIERTFRQEPAFPSMMNFGSQGLSANKLKSELLAMVTGSQQHAPRQCYPPSINARSNYMASLPQFSHTNLTDYGECDGWPTQSPYIPSQTNRVDGGAKYTTGADVSLGQGRDFTAMTGGRIQENFLVNGSRAPGAEFLSHSSSFSRGAQDLTLEGNRHLLTEHLRQKQRHQSLQAQASTLFSTNGDLRKVDSMTPSVGSGLLNQSHSAPASSGGLRVFCMNTYNLAAGGQLGLTDAGRLGVTCSCHGQHMSVAKFTQHSGINAANPGQVVFVEGGETLVQWRKSFFSQYGVKVPEDNVGWEWLDVVPAEAGHGKYKAVDAGPVETGHGKYKTVLTQSLQKEVDVSWGGSSPMMKCRTTEMWDASIANGNSSTLHATESISNTKFGLLNTGNGGMVDSREAMLRNYGQSHRAASMTSGIGSGQLYTASPHESLSRSQGNMGGSAFPSMSHAGHVAISNEHTITNDGGQRYPSAGQQVSGSARNGKVVNYPVNRWTDGQGQECRMRENDSSSSFELRLGQPSQQTQAAGTSFSSMATSSVEHSKSQLFNQIMTKVWDGKLQHNLQQLNPPILPKFSGIPGQTREQHGATTGRQSVLGRTERLESFGVEKRGEDRGSAYHSATQSTRQIFHSSQGAYEQDAVSEQVQGKLMSLESVHQSNLLSRNGDGQFRSKQSGSEKLAAKFVPHSGQARSVTLENGTSLDSLSTGALVQLSNKTGQRLLETAIQSSFTYRAMGLEGPGVQLKDGPSRGVVAESLSGDVNMFGRPSVSARVPFPEFLVKNQGQNDSGMGCRGAVNSANGSGLEQDPKLGFQMREQGPTFMDQRPVHRIVPVDYSTRCEETGRAPGAEHVSERSKLMSNRNEKQWQSQDEQGVVYDRQGQSQGGPEAESMMNPGLGSKVQNAEILSRLSQGDGESKGNETKHVDSQFEPLADSAAREVRGVDALDISAQGNLEVPSLSGGDLQCTCFKCRKASPSTRGQAVPRLAGKACLKEKGGLASTVEAAKRAALAEGEHNALEGGAQVQQPGTAPHSPERVYSQQPDTEPHSLERGYSQQPGTEPQLDAQLDTEAVEGRDCTRESSGQALPWVQSVRGTKANEGVEVGAECEEVIPGDEDVLSDTAAKGTAAGRGSPRKSAAAPDVCSNSSENVSSGLSDEGCAASGKGCPSLAQGTGMMAAPGAVDEGSGIGKCSSSDDVDMGVGTNMNALSVLEDPSKHASPSSLGCPSSSNMGKRLVVKRGGMRGTGGCHGSKEVEHNEEEAEPGANTGKLERKQRRNMKWKWLESGEDGGDAKQGSPASSFGHETETQVTSENARIGSKVQEAHARADVLTKDVRASSGEMLPPLKRRKLAIPRRHQEVKATNVTEENLDAAILSEDSKKKAETLVIRIPQSVNPLKAKKGIRTKLQSKCGARDWKSNAVEEGRTGVGDNRRESELGKSTAPKLGAPSKVPAACGSGSGKAGSAGPITVPTFLTKSLRSPRTPLAGRSPRNGRMVSLSVILKQAADASPVPRAVEPPAAQKLRDGASTFRNEGTIQKRLDGHVVTSSVTAGRMKGVKDQGHSDSGVGSKVSKPRVEGAIQKRLDAHVITESVAPGHVKEVKDGAHSDMGVAWKSSKSRIRGTMPKHTRHNERLLSNSVIPSHMKEVNDRDHPDMEVAWKGERRTRVWQKEDAQNRKVRSLLELTGKNNMHGPGAEVFDFAEDEDPAVLKAGKQATAAEQTDNPIAPPGSMGIKPCPVPRGERSARPVGSNRRKVEWHRSKDAQVEAGKSESGAPEAEKVSFQKGGTVVCDLSQERTTIVGIFSKTRHGEQDCLVRKQVRSSNVKKSKVVGEELQAKDAKVPDERLRMVDTGAVNHEVRNVQVKGGVTGFGVLKKRPSELLSLAGVSSKRPKMVHGLKKVKESLVSEIEGPMESGEQLKSCKGELLPDTRKLKEPVDNRLGSNLKMHIKGKPTYSKEVAGSLLKKEKAVASFEVKKPNLHERSKCDVCGIFTSASYNKLLCCGRCPVKVHQACYGVPKIPKGPWSCRTCKFKVTNPICVLCGYGCGAMTRVHKARSLCHGLLQAWRDVKDENLPDSFSEDDDETLLSVTNNCQSSRNRLAAGLAGKIAKKIDTKVRECESCDCEEPRDDSSVCKVCRKDSPEPGSSGGNVVKCLDREVNANSGHEGWRRNNTVGSILKDAQAKQWSHMVCTLWMPGTRCLNMGTMGVFDVSGVTVSRRKMLCSICHRKGGACIQCRVPKCSTPFHVWCAHEKGLLQSETVQDGSNQVGFFGKCQSHGDYCGSELDDTMKEALYPASGEICARTEGYKGKLSLEERAKAQQRMTLEGFIAVTPEQVAAALRIDDRKMPTRRFLKPANSAMKCDHREYLRFKQKKGWKKLAVYKSGIHALGLYTTDFIAEGEVVVEYVGEIVGSRVADKREAEYHSGKRLQYQGACYLFRIDTDQIIDATRKGGIARFVNHSCSPNCVAKVICVENLKKVIFFAKRDIYAGEEVTYDYKFNCDEVGDKIPCFCGTPECRGTLN